MNLDTRKTLLAAILVFFAVSLRVIEHPFNATPMVAVLLFSAAIFRDWKWKIAIPAIALLLSDVLIELKYGYGFHSSVFLVYGAFALIFLVGYYMLRRPDALRILTASVVSSTLFFLVTNFAFFYPEAAVANPALGHYPHNLHGIVVSYQAGLPFYKNMIVGDIVFSTVLFGVYYVIQKASWFSRESLA